MEPRFADRLEWEVTRACDLECRHCLNRSHQPRPRELDTEESLAVAAELGRLGCRVATLSGGEPTLRSDWPQIAQVLARSGVIVHLVTNGQRFGRTEARLARAAGVGGVQVSVDGCDVTHDRIRRRPGAFAQVERAAGRLVDAGVPLGFFTTVSQDNAAQLDDLAAWVSRWDPAVWKIWLGAPRRGRLGWLPLDALPNLMDRLSRLQQAHPYLRVQGRPGQGARPHASGREVLGLRSDGTVTTSLALPDAPGLGSVRHSPLPHLWRAAKAARRQLHC